MNGTIDICIELYIVVLDKQRDVHTNSMMNDVINFINRRGVLVTTLCVKFGSDLLQVDGFLRVLRFPTLKNLPPRNNCNIVESGVQYRKPKAHSISFQRTLTTIDVNFSSDYYAFI